MMASAPAKNAADYYGHERPEMLRLIPPTATRVLEIGCAAGVFAASVKRTIQAEVWGVEYDVRAAERACLVVDHLLIGDVDTCLAEIPNAYFDVVVCNDVLEHLVEPSKTLALLQPKLRRDGVVVASLPNIRYAPALGTILFGRDFPKDDEGIFDRTHLHFFTRKSIVRTFEKSGFAVRTITGINPHYGPLAAIFTILSLGYFVDSFFLQYACVASPSSA